MRHRISTFAVIGLVGFGLTGCATLSTVASGGTVTPAMVEADAVAACGFLPSAETASNLIQAATTTAGSATAVTDADYTALAEQLANLACTVAGATAVSTAPDHHYGQKPPSRFAVASLPPAPRLLGMCRCRSSGSS